MDRQIINNAFLEIEIDSFLKKQNLTKEGYIEFCVSKDVCIGIITQIKVSPYYFNKTGKKLMYLFLDIDTKKSSVITKNGKAVNLNSDKNKIKNW